jgi:hypothetical protein
MEIKIGKEERNCKELYFAGHLFSCTCNIIKENSKCHLENYRHHGDLTLFVHQNFILLNEFVDITIIDEHVKFKSCCTLLGL